MTDQTPPTDRPLTAGDVHLLREGDVLRYDGHLVFYRGAEGGEPRVQFGPDGWSARVAAGSLTFVSRPAASDEGVDAVASIIAERARQVSVEGWTPEHDDEHDDYSLGLAAASYAGGVDCGSKIATYTDDVSIRGECPVWGTRKKRVPVPWPDSWDPRWWKPTGDRRRDLVKAGALIVAEIERLDRKAAL